MRRVLCGPVCNGKTNRHGKGGGGNAAGAAGDGARQVARGHAGKRSADPV